MKYTYENLSREQTRVIVPAVAVFEALRKSGDRFLAETHDLLGTVQPTAVLAGLAREVDALRTGMAKAANAVSNQLRAAGVPRAPLEAQIKSVLRRLCSDCRFRCDQIRNWPSFIEVAEDVHAFLHGERQPVGAAASAALRKGIEKSVREMFRIFDAGEVMDSDLLEQLREMSADVAEDLRGGRLTAADQKKIVAVIAREMKKRKLSF